MAALPGLGLLAHGGVAGAIVEAFVALAVGAVLVAVWLRERRVRRERAEPRSVVLRDDE